MDGLLGKNEKLRERVRGGKIPGGHKLEGRENFSFSERSSTGRENWGEGKKNRREGNSTFGEGGRRTGCVRKKIFGGEGLGEGTLCGKNGINRRKRKEAQ